MFRLVDDGGYSEWSSWSQCSVTCGDGRRSHSRSCTNPPPSPGGKDCSQLGPDNEFEDCNDGGCPGFVSLNLTTILKIMMMMMMMMMMMNDDDDDDDDDDDGDDDVDDDDDD